MRVGLYVVSRLLQLYACLKHMLYLFCWCVEKCARHVMFLRWVIRPAKTINLVIVLLNLPKQAQPYFLNLK